MDCSPIDITLNGQTTSIGIVLNYTCKNIWLDINYAPPEAIYKRDRFTITDDFTYTLASNYFIDKIVFKSDTALTARIGTTDGGDEVYLENDIDPDTWYSVGKDVFGLQNLYFTGFSSAETIVNIYKRKL